MAIEFTIDYATLVNAARTLDAANTEYHDLSSVLQTVRDNLVNQYFVGQTGPAASAFLEALLAEIATASTHFQTISAALNQTVQSIRDQVDPQMASRFQ